ncbi:MAG: hypothetical protein M1455_09310 [Actinobacteria bacterium]|nr:hypothetical protein [Actinomycetota bacterium]
MPGTASRLAAVHFYYLLKSDDEELHKLWSALTGGAPRPAAPELEFLEEGNGEEGSGGGCRIVHRVESGATGVCLMSLPDLSVIEVSYPAGEGALEEVWRQASAAIEADRARLSEQASGVFGETTVLVGPALGAAAEDLRAASGYAGPVLSSNLTPGTIPDAAAAGPLLLAHFPGHSRGGRDFYAVASDDPAAFIDNVFPLMDSLIKKLVRTASYFEQQRQTIASERSEVDRDVGSLLHRQVVGGAAAASTAGGVSAPGAPCAPEDSGAASLEGQINALSRMFGMLATDSLLIRQSSESMAGDIKLLQGEFARLGNAGANEIGHHYLGRFNADLAEAKAEAKKLEFARQNAQAAIEVVRTQVEILRAGEEAVIQQQSQEILSRSLVLQKERLALQVAAGFIEFVLVFYYVLKSWEGIAGTETFDHVSRLARFIVVGAFSGSAAIGTHYLAQVLQRDSLKSRGLWFSVAVLVLSAGAMVMLTVAYE